MNKKYSQEEMKGNALTLLKCSWWNGRPKMHEIVAFLWNWSLQFCIIDMYREYAKNCEPITTSIKLYPFLCRRISTAVFFNFKLEHSWLIEFKIIRDHLV